MATCLDTGSSPLLLVKLSDGIGLASDALAFGEKLRPAIPRGGWWFCYSEDELHVYDSDLESPTIQALNWQPVPVHPGATVRITNGAGTYMRHEILEQWRTMARPIPDEVGEAALQNLIRKRRRIIVTGAGGAASLRNRWLTSFKVERNIKFWLCLPPRFNAISPSWTMLCCSLSARAARRPIRCVLSSLPDDLMWGG